MLRHVIYSKIEDCNKQFKSSGFIVISSMYSVYKVRQWVKWCYILRYIRTFGTGYI